MTQYDGQNIIYDEIGNPLSDGTWNYTWEHGRQLSSMSNGSVTWTYTYDANGHRKSRKGTTNYEYIYDGNRLSQMNIDEDVRYVFIYDGESPVALRVYNQGAVTTYYYVTNLQGDVVAILNKAGKAVVEYSYDAWGNVQSITGDYKDGLGLRNPLMYRGYVYDRETKLYYLNSRYYDPETGRFLNADNIKYLGANGTLTSYNLFAYCLNSPVMINDPTGHFGLAGAIIATSAIVGGLLGAFSAATTGGNVLESTIEGCLTGALGAACGLLISSSGLAVIAAVAGGAVIDFATQAMTQYIQNKSVNLSEIDGWRVAKTAAQTGIGTAIPKFGQGANNAVDAFGTAVMWAEASTMIVCADVIVTNTVAVAQSSSKSVSRNRRAVLILKREMLLR